MKIIEGGVTAPKDYKAAALNCGIKRKRDDLALLASTVPAVACGMFTQNRVKGAPILVTKGHLNKTIAQAVIVNSGNANCCTGKEGVKNAHEMARLAAEGLGIEKEDVLVASTGVIGRQLPMEKIAQAVPFLIKGLARNGGHNFAQAIMTTDKTAKEIAVKIKIKDKDVIIGGAAKGAGMIHPNMATMLCFITTDAYITRRGLKRSLVNAVDRSFNSISVDGDTSTNDCVLALANGSAANALLDRKDKKDFAVFEDGVGYVADYLAKAIVRDGEGATKFAEIKVVNAKTLEGAKRIARKVATSPLFKTALFGHDPNWGRIAACVGASGVIFDPAKLDIYIGKMKVLKNGVGSSEKKEALARFFKNTDIDVTVDLNSGNKDYKMWTCDLSLDYIKINAHYTT